MADEKDYLGDKSSLVTGRSYDPQSKDYEQPQPASAVGEKRVLYGTGQSPQAKFISLAFAVAITGMVLITTVLSLVRGFSVSGVYLLLGVNILCIAIIELILIYWVKKDELSVEKTWFLYFVGICIFVEACLTDVLLYQ